MAIEKTRNMLIDVARKLFSRMGVEHTTMNDIAVASQKGRRTLYTYFKNKNEVYLAVVETEIERMIEALRAVSAKTMPANEKLLLFFYTRFDAVKKVVLRNGTLKADFFRDIWRVETVRKRFDEQETQIIASILQQGIDEGIFEMPNVNLTAEILHHSLKGLEVPYIRGHIRSRNILQQEKRENIAYLILEGIRKKDRDALSSACAEK